jgi:small nuclear ribonucleoprotein (snRNP)-like protein
MRLMKKKVIINTKSNKAFRGILWRRWFGLIILKQVEMLWPGGEVKRMDGEVILFKSDVDFIQVL